MKHTTAVGDSGIRPSRSAAKRVAVADTEPTPATTPEVALTESAVHTATGIAGLDSNGHVQWADDAFCSIVGVQHEHLASRGFWEFLHPEDVAVFSAAVQRVRHDALPHYTMDIRLVYDNSPARVIAVTVSLARSPNGRSRQLLAVVRDRSNSSPESEVLSHAAPNVEGGAGQLAAMFEAMADGVIVFDREGRVVRVNPAYRTLLALDSRPDWPSLPLVERGGLLNFRDEFGQEVPIDEWLPSRVLRGDVVTGTNTLDLMVRGLDGRDLFANASGAPVRDAQGTIVGGVLIFRDVTERRRLERQTHEALTALLEVAETLVADQPDPSQEVAAGTVGVPQRLATLTGAVLMCQRVTIVPVGPNAEVQPTWAIAGSITPEERQQWQATSPQPEQRRLQDFLPSALLARLELGELILIDRRLPPFDRWPNPMAWCSMLLVPMRLGRQLVGVLTLDYGPVAHQCTADEMALAGGVARLVALVLERERLLREREAERAQALAMTEANRRMDEFLGIATHELKTPVTSSSLSVALAGVRAHELHKWLTAHDDEPNEVDHLNEQARQVASLEDLLAGAEVSLERLQRLVVDLLDVSRIRAGKLEMRPAYFDLTTVVREAVEEQRLLAPARTIRVHLPARRTASVVADMDRIRQVVTNYLTNALKYSEADRPVDVRMHVRGDWVRLSVRDEGPGLPRTEHQHIWERFHRVEGIRVVSGAGTGLGLGLHIGKTIVEQHRGQIGVRSAPGKGSTFWFALPLATESES